MIENHQKLIKQVVQIVVEVQRNRRRRLRSEKLRIGRTFWASVVDFGGDAPLAPLWRRSGAALAPLWRRSDAALAPLGAVILAPPIHIHYMYMISLLV